MVTTVKATVRYNKDVFKAANAAAKTATAKEGKKVGYQTVINRVLAKVYGVTLPPHHFSTAAGKKKVKAAKRVEVLKPLKASKPKAKKKVKAKSKKK